MKRIALFLGLIVPMLASCAGAPSLLTGIPPGMKSDTGKLGCYTNSASGLLVADPKYSTAIIDVDLNPSNTVATPVAWLPGFTARHSGSEVEVLDPAGKVVATTGHRYRLPGASIVWPGMTGGIFWACDTPMLLPGA